jgi:hypothetical protein
MRGVHLIGGLYVLSNVVAASQALFSREVSDNPSATNFLRRAFQAALLSSLLGSHAVVTNHVEAVILGSYLYIHGGEFSQIIGGNPDPG